MAGPGQRVSSHQPLARYGRNDPCPCGSGKKCCLAS
ncbi:hypothetical protein FJW06_13885 [Mesorhizobium sp. B4-1-3]|nr:hypothetical protein FJW06_13885 [Mesorhizobium sp. B4-1-3]